MTIMITNIGENLEMKLFGIGKKKQEDLSEIEKQTQPMFTRRDGLKWAGKAIAVGMTAGAISKAEKVAAAAGYASEGAYLQNLEANKPNKTNFIKTKSRKYKEPSAVAVASEVEKRAWFDYHRRDDGVQWRAISTLDHAQESLKLTSPIYHLLRAKTETYGRNETHTEEELKQFLFNTNPGLYYFAIGTKHLYGGTYKNSRENFATGMMISANLNENEYQLIRNQGINVTKTGNIHEDAHELAQAFINAPIQQKLIIDRIFQKRDKNEIYFWNLGFFSETEYQITKKSQRHIYKENHTYSKLQKKFNYHTYSNALLKY